MKRTLYLKALLPMLTFALVQLAMSELLALTGMDTTSASFLGLTVTLAGLITVAVLAVARFVRPVAAFRPGKWQWGTSAVAFAGTWVGIFGVSLLSEKVALPDIMEESFTSLAYSPWGVIAVVLVGPLAEELVFREGVQGFLHRHGAPLWPALLTGAVTFGLIHANPAQIPFAMCIGVLLGLIYHRTHNVLLTSIIHIANNAVTMATMRALESDTGTFDIQEALGGPAICWVHIVVCLGVCAALMRYYWTHTASHI